MRDTGSPAVCPPTMAAVIGIIGYTHGVRLVSTPPRKSAGSARAGLPLRSWARSDKNVNRER
jgi:hypothetical protein